MGVQHAPNHAPRSGRAAHSSSNCTSTWHVDDVEAAGQQALALGDRLLQSARPPADNPDGHEVFAVQASPAGHPFCFGSQ